MSQLVQVEQLVKQYGKLRALDGLSLSVDLLRRRSFALFRMTNDWMNIQHQ